MNGDQDGRDVDEPQSPQLDNQAQILINTQRELAKVKDSLAQATQSIGHLFLEKQQSQQRICALEKQVDELGARPEAALPTTPPSSVDQDELLAYSRALKSTREELKSSEEERKRLKEILEMYERELSGLRRELQETKSISDKRGEELAGPMAFLQTADTVPIADIIQKVISLNGEIFLAAATLGDSMEYMPPDAVTTETFNLGCATTRAYISENLVNILCKESRNRTEPCPNPLLVQVLLRIFLVMFCSGIIQSWSPNDLTAAGDLATVYNKIKGKEHQSVAGRWRSLTRFYTRPAVEAWKKQLLQDLSHVLHVACWIPGIEQHKSFQKSLDDVVSATQHLRNTLGEDFISADLDITVVEAGQPLQPSFMRDAYDNGGREATEKQDTQEIVVGTVEIGLKKTTVKRSADGAVVYENMLSAKVALESAIKEALAPAPPPRKSRKKPVIRKPAQHGPK